MANYSVLKAAVQAVVKTNGNQEITGANMQSTLISIINSLGTGYQFMGVATPSTNPGTPDQREFYITGEAGTYTNFNSLVVTGIAVLYYDTAWHVTNVADVTELLQDSSIGRVDISVGNKSASMASYAKIGEIDSTQNVLENKTENITYTKTDSTPVEEIIIGDTEENYITKIKGRNVYNNAIVRCKGVPFETKNIHIDNKEVSNTSNGIDIYNKSNKQIISINDDGLIANYLTYKIGLLVMPTSLTEGEWKNANGTTTTNRWYCYFKYDVSNLERVSLTTVLTDSAICPIYVGEKNNVAVYQQPKLTENVIQLTADVSEFDYIYINVIESATNMVSVNKMVTGELGTNVEKLTTVFLGDSIMQGVGSHVGCNCVDYANKILDYNAINVGVGGTHMALKTNDALHMPRIIDAITTGVWTFVDSVVDSWSSSALNDYTKNEFAKLKLLEVEQIDIVFLSYGYNDWRYLSVLDNLDNPLDETTCLGALRSGVAKLLTANPKLKIYFATPSYATAPNPTYQDMTLQQYGNHIADCCADLHIPCRNQWTICNVNETNMSALYADSVHRNSLGYKLLGEQYAKFILSF